MQVTCAKFFAGRFGAAFLLLALVFLPAPPASAVTQLQTVAVGHTPGQLVVNTTAHLIYVVNQGDNTVSIIDSQQLKVKAVVKVGTAPGAIAADPPANLVYVANAGSGTVSKIVGTKASGTLPVGGTPIALVVDSALNQLYVADGARNQVEIFNTTKGTLLATVPTTLQPTAMALNVATHAVFVACTGSSGSAVVIDGTKNQMLTTINSLPAGTTSLSIDPASNVAMLTSPSTNLTAVIDAANGYTVTIGTGEAGANAMATAYDADGLFFLADNGDGNIFYCTGDGLFNLGDAYQTHASGATAIAVNPTTNQIGTVYPQSADAFIIDLINPLYPGAYHQVTTGLTPTGIAFDPLANRVFITNAGDNTVSVFDISPRSIVPAYEGNYGNNSIGYNYIDVNPATGTAYTLRLGNLFAINEAKAGQGSNGSGGNAAGVTTIALGSAYSSAVAVNAATDKIYAADGQGFFYSVDGATNTATLVASVPSNANIEALAVDSATNEILAWDYSSNNLYVLDGTTESLLKTISLTAHGSQGTILVDPVKNLAYVALYSVVVVDPAAGTVVATIPISSQPFAAALNPAASRLYVIMNGGLAVIDTSTNSVVTTTALSYNPESVAVNPVTGNYYVGLNDGGSGTPHVFIYSGATNALIADLSGKTYPEITGAVSLAISPLTDTIYVGSDNGTGTASVAAIDGFSNAVAALPPNAYDSAAHALAVDLGSGVLAGAGYSYTSLWFPTSDVAGAAPVPIAVTFAGVKDSQTIATSPLFRTHNTQPSFVISATSNFPQSASSLVPKHAFYQVDSWLGTWKTATLSAKSGSVTATAKVKLPTLTTGRHVLYAYAALGDVATVQNGAQGENSPVISPIGSVVFTVEK